MSWPGGTKPWSWKPAPWDRIPDVRLIIRAGGIGVFGSAADKKPNGVRSYYQAYVQSSYLAELYQILRFSEIYGDITGDLWRLSDIYGQCRISYNPNMEVRSFLGERRGNVSGHLCGTRIRQEPESGRRMRRVVSVDGGGEEGRRIPSSTKAPLITS